MNDEMTSQAYWDQRYAKDAYVFGEAPNRFLARQAELLRPGMRALAVADGEGRNSVWLAERGIEVVATEISPLALAKARALANARGVSVDFRQADLLEWDWPEAEFELVVAIFIQVFGPEERALVFEKTKRALRPGGLILIEGYRPEQLGYGTGGPGVLENLYTETMLRAAFADFAIERVESYDAELDEGARHRGISAVIDLVARKPA